MVTLALIDDHASFREGMRALLEGHYGMRVLLETGTVRAALESNEVLRADVVLLDVAMPGMNGVAGAREICYRRKDARVLILSAHCRPELVRDATRAGALGFALKNGSPDELVEAIHSVAEGRSWLAPALRGMALGGDPDPLTRLTARERDVFDLLVRGYNNVSIALELCISENTVERHRQNVLHKCGVHSLGELMTIASTRQLIWD